jgi:alpha-tubulin suppressor-like RCC1 family protein
LGISPDIEIAAAPSFVKFFHKVAIQSVAAGSHHSLAITEDGDLYSWGEGKLGQLGLGKCREKRMPQRVAFDFDGQEEETGEKSQRVRACAAGFGHTAALTDGGSLYMWGFNVYGQVGVGDKKTRWHPEQICYSAAGEQLPQFSKVACSKYATYAIDSLGRPYSWGKGYTGH